MRLGSVASRHLDPASGSEKRMQNAECRMENRELRNREAGFLLNSAFCILNSAFAFRSLHLPRDPSLPPRVHIHIRSCPQLRGPLRDFLLQTV
jgi:hypothetical protein